MSKAALSVLSFVLGAFFASVLVSGIYTSMEPQSLFAADTPRVQPTPVQPRLTGIGIELGYGPPLIFPLTGKGWTDFTADTVSAMLLDGVDCHNCTFANVSFVYGGGDWRCDHCRFPNSWRSLTLVGAAANTLHTIQTFQMMNQLPKAPSMPGPKEGFFKVVQTQAPTFDDVSFEVIAPK